MESELPSTQKYFYTNVITTLDTIASSYVFNSGFSLVVQIHTYEVTIKFDCSCSNKTETT